MINGNDLIKHNYWPYIYLTYVFLTQMCISLKLGGMYICTLHIAYIFLNERVLQTFFENVCIYPGLKYETLNFALHLTCLSLDFFCPACFHIIGVC